MTGKTDAGCCITAGVFIVVLGVLWVAAIVWSILDLTSGHTERKVLDIVILVIAALSALGGVGGSTKVQS